MKYFCVLYVLCFTALTHLTAQDNLCYPNIVFILADDLGYGDISCLNENGKIPTPNIDRIAEAGVIFTDAHSGSAVCTPTRYGILTGRYSWRSILKKGALGIYAPPIMDPRRTNMAFMLKGKGYQTACIGKWHLGRNWPTTDGKPPTNKQAENNLNFSAPTSGGPLDLGFDYYFGTNVPNYPPYCFMENRKTVGIPSVYYDGHPYDDCRPGMGIKDWRLDHILPALKEKAVEYISESAKNNKPFFLYLPLTAPHTPIAPSEEFVNKSGLNAYADFVMEVDNLVGEILNVLRDSGINENTIVVFTSDNGCAPMADFPFLEKHGHDPSYIYRGHKADFYEGGHRIPCLVQWPSKVKKAKTIDQIICLNDFMATFAEIVDYQLTDSEAEDSYSLLPLLVRPKSNITIRNTIVHHSSNGSFAIRKDNWKLLVAKGSGGWSYPHPGKDYPNLPPVQLYNLGNDPSEEKNVQAEYPNKVDELRRLLIKYIEEGRSTKGTPQKNDGEYPWKQIESIL